MLQDPLGHGLTQEGITTGDGPNSSQQRAAVGIFEHVTACAGAYGGENRLIVFEHGQHDDPDRRVRRRDGAGGVDAAHARHLEVHQHDVWLQLRYEANGFLARRRLADQLDVCGTLLNTRVSARTDQVGSGARSGSLENVRTHRAAIIPCISKGLDQPPANAGGSDLFGTILTGEMFAPILTEQIDIFNRLRGTRLQVLAVPNSYFGGDVAVAGLLTGQDLLNVKDKIAGDFAILPKHTLKSDEPIFLDGMSYDELKNQFSVPAYALDTRELFELLSNTSSLNQWN